MIDIDELEQLAKLVGGDAWTPTYASRTTDAAVWLPDGDSVCQCHWSIGHQPEPIDADDVAEYIAAVSPANVLALIAEVRALRAKLETPIAMKIKWSPMESTMIDGWSPEVAEDALSRGKKVTVYYGKTLDVQRGAK